MTDGLRVNFSEKEASSEARSMELLPRGDYHVAITDIELRESQSEKNFGKPYWGMEFTIQEGPYDNRKLWTNCMLFEGALYTFAQLMKALGYDTSAGEFEVPDPNDLIGQQVVVAVAKQGKRTNKETGEEYDERNEVKGIKAYDPNTFTVGATQKTAAKAGGKSSLLP
jgi:hypothetical protein